MRLALAQLDIAWEDKTSNKETALQFIKQAASEKVDMILFPEMTLTGFSMNTSLIGEINSETTEFFKQMSLKFNIYIGFGYVEGVSNSKNKYSVVDPSGALLVNYTKIHPFSFASETKFYQSGTQVEYFNALGFTISPFICYDLRFPEIFQVASKSATLITIAANWPEGRRAHWITLLKARAIENQCYIAGINRIGQGNSISYSGDSMIIDPLGNVVSSLYMEDGLIIADIYAKEVANTRDTFKFKADRNDDLYCSMYSDN